MELLSPEAVNKLFCIYSKKWNVERHLLKAVAIVESSMNQMAYRFEPLFWKNYKDKFPELADRDPEEVSASYGLMQVMFTTAWRLGFRGAGVELYNPVINIELGARLLNQLFGNLVYKDYYKNWPQEICLAQYNGGSSGNPGLDGSLRNYAYTRKVLAAYRDVRMKEVGCGKTE